MPKPRAERQVSRRGFLKAAAVAAAPMIIPGRALGLNGATAPSNRITLGFIGLGRMNSGHLDAFLRDDGVQVLALAEVWRSRLEDRVNRVHSFYAKRLEQPDYHGCAGYNDFRELCARPDIDAVVIATPNQWHALNAIEAARNGKDIYLEKPMTRDIAEGRAIIDAVRRYGRILQVGSQQRSDTAFRFACELVRNGRIGKIERVHVNVGPTSEDFREPGQPTPEGLDWDMWLGPAPWRPYHPTLCPPDSFDGWPEWRYYRDYAGGGMDDFGAHHYDIAQWGLGTDDTGPVEITPPAEGKTGLTYRYANGVIMEHGGGAPRAAVEWVGTEGRVRVNRGQYLETEPASLQYEKIGPNEIRLYASNNHKDNFLEAVRTRREPICPPEIGHRTATICHLGNIAYWLGRPLRWDPAVERFIDDEGANRMIHRPMRGPWHL